MTTPFAGQARTSTPIETREIENSRHRSREKQRVLRVGRQTSACRRLIDSIRGNMVNAKKRDILERYRFLLENNLLLTDELLAWFKGKNGLSELTISDIKVRRAERTSAGSFRHVCRRRRRLWNATGNFSIK